MLALIRMDWTLNRRILLQMTPWFLLQSLLAFAHGLRGLLGASFMAAAVLMLIPVFQNLRNTVEPFLCALPVSRAQIVVARYLSVLAVLTLVSLAYLALGWAGHGIGYGWARDMVFQDLATGLALQGLLLATGLFLYLPFHFRFGGDLAVSLFACSLVVGVGLLLLAFGWRGVMDHGLTLLARFLDGGATRMGGIGACLGLGAVSLGISVPAYQRRVRRVHLTFLLPILFLGVVLGGVGMALQGASRQAALAQTREALETLLAPHFNAHHPGAAVLVARDGQTLLRKGYGLARVEARLPNTPDGPFRIGSVTKQFTAALVLLLVEEGRIELARPIGAYVPEVPPAWGKVTVEQCLNHTGGIPNYTHDPGFEQGRGRKLSPAQVLEAYTKGKPLDFEPGSRFKYSNTDYLLLGMALEQVSGQPYGRLVEERLCRPLGLAHTHLAADSSPLRGYTKDGQLVPDYSMSQAFSAGALESTVDDLATWTLALHGGSLLKPASYQRMIRSGRTSDGKPTGYGYGLIVSERDGSRTLWHGGVIDGFSSYLAFDPARKAVVVLLFNTDAAPALPVARLMDAACGRAFLEPKAIGLPQVALDTVAGAYVHESGALLRIWREGPNLKGQIIGQPPFELFAESPTHFFLKVVEATLDFELGADGKAVGLVLNQGGMRIPFRWVG